MAKEAGYALPTDTAIALGASTISEPEPPVEPVYNHEDGPPPVSEPFGIVVLTFTIPQN